MIPLADLMRKSGYGDGLDELARQYGLSSPQIQRAMDSLLPAFSEALKRNTGDPLGFLQFMRALAQGEHEKYFRHPDAALSHDGVEEGNAILGHLFGSKEASRSVATHASQFSGISQDVLKQLLPSVAAILLGGLHSQMTTAGENRSKGREAGGDPGQNPLGWIIEQMAGDDLSRGSSSTSWTDMIDRMTGGGGSGGGDNPLGKIFEDMLRGEPRRPQQRHDDAQPRMRRKDPSRNLEDLFGDLFETGRSVQDEYQRNLESIFDEFQAGGKKR